MMKTIKTINSNDPIYHYHQYENKDQIFLVVRNFNNSDNLWEQHDISDLTGRLKSISKSTTKMGVTMGVALDGFNRCCNGCYNRLGVRQLTQDRRIKKP